jgi:hypothetical protein
VKKMPGGEKERTASEKLWVLGECNEASAELEANGVLLFGVVIFREHPEWVGRFSSVSRQT